jgi:hypothetical protein
MTKEEIILWLRSQAAYYLRPGPKISELLFIRWQLLTKKIHAKDLEIIDELEKIDCAKYDDYARQFNASKDIEEKARLCNLMKPIRAQLADNMTKSVELRKEWDKCNALYARIDIERAKENATK